jgi:pyruvate kinase
MLCSLMRAGMNVARLNFSHGTHESHQRTIDNFKKAREMVGVPCALLLDTKGPEIRIGTFENPAGITLVKDAVFTLTTEQIPGTEKKVSVTHHDLHNQLKVGQRILIDDGRVELVVTEIADRDIVCKVLHGGKLTNNKGVNIPNCHIEMEYLSERDKSDILFGIQNDIDFVAASFVRCVDDVIKMRRFLDINGGRNVRIIAKIENLEGIQNYDEILAVSGGIMVARGDMGVEVEYEKIPGIQKQFIRKCRCSGKMVITATQMLESMTEKTMPTRAEITDVANAVFDGTSAVMLSGETAMGKHPLLVVQTMDKIVRQAEKDHEEYKAFVYEVSEFDKTNAICDAACTTAKDLEAKAIVAVTLSGETARLVSKFRPKEMIIAATPSLKTYHQLALSWGVSPVLTSKQNSEEALIDDAIYRAKSENLLKKGDTVVVTAGVPLDVPGTTNLLRIVTV